jgi:hypothetical protein
VAANEKQRSQVRLGYVPCQAPREASRILRARSAIVTTSPKTATRIGQVVRLPSVTGVPSPQTTIPA